VVTALWEADPRPFVWIDDDLALFDGALDWLTGLPSDRVLPIIPDPTIGLTPAHLDVIDQFVTTHQDTN
jgi:hypothetical protein